VNHTNQQQTQFLFQEDEKSKHKEIKGKTIEDNRKETENQQTEKVRDE